MPARTPEQCDALFARHLGAGDGDAVVGAEDGRSRSSARQRNGTWRFMVDDPRARG